jgi:hypothetical protein
MFSDALSCAKSNRHAAPTDDLRGRTLSDVTQPKPRVEPLDPPMVPFAVAGLAAFAVAGVIVWLAGGPGSWLDTCVAGFLVGIPGLITATGAAAG